MLKTIFFNPIYNVYVVLVNIIPGHDLGLAIILLTVLFKLAIYPLYRKAIITNLRLKEINPQLEEIKKKYKDNQTEQAKKMMELYKNNNINPFSGFWVIIVQIPIFLTLFYVFRGDINSHLSSLYSFVQAPENFNKLFLGIFDLSANKNYLFAVLTGLTQYYQTKLTLPASSPAPTNGAERSFADDFGRSMNTQMLYVMPVVIAFVSASVPAAVCLYWITSNTMSIVLELIYQKKK
ncbi:MAG: YidC/Oxa1 family membrane protein insertase [Candidatus Paceibacterota bacterium]|jgi:YidC/Oxa1 family membrane protein insertase